MPRKFVSTVPVKELWTRRLQKDYRCTMMEEPYICNCTTKFGEPFLFLTCKYVVHKVWVNLFTNKDGKTWNEFKSA